MVGREGEGKDVLSSACTQSPLEFLPTSSILNHCAFEESKSAHEDEPQEAM